MSTRSPRPRSVTTPVDQMLADLVGDLADRRRVGDGDREVDRGGPARQLDVDLGAGRKVGVRADAEKPAAAATGEATSLAAWLAIFSITLWSIISRPRPGAAARRGMASTVDAGVSAVRWTGRPARSSLPSSIRPTTNPAAANSKNDHERDPAKTATTPSAIPTITANWDVDITVGVPLLKNVGDQETPGQPSGWPCRPGDQGPKASGGRVGSGESC